MAIQPNYLARGGDPYAGAIGVNEDAMSSIGTALFGNPQMAGQRALRTAQAESYNLQNEQLRRSISAGDEIGASLSRAFVTTNPDGSTRPATFQEALPRLGDLFKNGYWANQGDPTKAMAWLRGFTALTGNEDLTRAGFAAAGGAPGQDYAGTTGRAEEVRAANAKNDKDRATAVAGIGAGATVQAARIREDGETGRQRSRLQWDEANPSYDRYRAGVARAFTEDPLLDTDTRTQRQRDIVAPGVVSAEERARGQVAAAGARADGNVRVAEVRGVSAENVARLVQEGRVTVADIQAAARVQAAESTAGATVTSADRAAAARVEAALIGLQGVQDTNRTRQGVADTQAATATTVQGMRGDNALAVQGARNDGAVTVQGMKQPTVPKVGGAEIKAIDSDIESALASKKYRLDDAGKAWVRNRASELFQAQAIGQKNIITAVDSAMDELIGSNPPDNSYAIGRLFGGPQYGAPRSATPPPAPGGPALVPAQPDAPAAAPLAAPPRPASAPPGSAYSPSRGMWRAPDGRMFTKDGVPAA